MSLASLFATGKMVLSCELFPPRTAKGEKALYRHVEKLIQFDPDFIKEIAPQAAITAGLAIRRVNDK